MGFCILFITYLFNKIETNVERNKEKAETEAAIDQFIKDFPKAFTQKCEEAYKIKAQLPDSVIHNLCQCIANKGEKTLSKNDIKKQIFILKGKENAKDLAKEWGRNISAKVYEQFTESCLEENQINATVKFKN